MGAVRIRVQTDDKHHSNPHHSSPSVNILRTQNLCVSKKQIHHYASIQLSPVKRSSGLKSAPIKQRLQAKTVQNKDSMLVVSDVRRQQVDEEIPPDECLEKKQKITI